MCSRSRWRTTRSAPCFVRVNTSTESSVSSRSRRASSVALSVARHRIDGVRHRARRLRAAAHLNDDRLAQILPRQRLDFGRHRRAEEQRLPIARDFGDDAIDLRREAHVEHAIRFVEHEHFEIVEHDVLPLEMVDQPARRRHDDVDAGAQLLLLRLERHAAVDRHDAQVGVARVLVNALFDLDAQFARRREHERAGAARAADQPLDDRKRERGGLAGAGLREAHHVAPLEDERNRFRLDRGRGLVARVEDCLQNFGRESDLLERRASRTSADRSTSVVSISMIPIATHRGRAPRTILGPVSLKGAGEQRARRPSSRSIGSAFTRGVAAHAYAARRPPCPRPSWRFAQGDPCRRTN